MQPHLLGRSQDAQEGPVTDRFDFESPAVLLDELIDMPNGLPER